MKVGLLFGNDLERIFAIKEWQLLGEFEFLELSSFSECYRYLIDGRIDVCITTMYEPSKVGVSELLDWFSFSWYEDYPHDVVFEGNGAGETVVVSHSQIERTSITLGEDGVLPVSGKLEEVVGSLKNGSIHALVVPGRLARYLEQEQWFEGFRKHLIPVGDRVEPEFSAFFLKGNSTVLDFVPHFVKAVTFVGGGVGDAGMCTLSGIEALRVADVCLYDSLLDCSLLNYLPPNAEIVDVGKRCHKHRMKQFQITRLIVEYARKGFRVVRLKGGDPSIFGRLAEEVDYLERHHIPYRVIPGVSSLNAMAARTGIVLTRRGVSRGFCVMSPIKHGGAFAGVDSGERLKLPIVFFMGVRVVDEIVSSLIDDGVPPDTPASMVFSIGTQDELVVRGRLRNISKLVLSHIKGDYSPPGLFVVGEIAGFGFKDFSLLSQRNFLVAGSGKAAEIVTVRLRDFGGCAVVYKPPPVVLYSIERLLERVHGYDALAFSEGTVLEGFIRGFMDRFGDLLLLPKILVSSSEVAAHLRGFGITHNKPDEPGKNVLYVYARRDDKFVECLKRSKCVVDEGRCRRLSYRKEAFGFDCAIFTDEESFWSFVDAYGISFMEGCILWVPDVDGIKEFLKKREINFNITPNCLGVSCSDVRFFFRGLI